MIYDQPRMTSPLLEAQQKLLQSRTPVRYQPLLTPDNYLNFYGTPQGIAPSAQDLLYPTIQRGAVAAPVATGGSYMPMSTGGDSGSSGQSEPSACSQMSEAERAAWVQANPGTYIAGKTLASAVLPGGMLLAGMQDPYLNMSLAEYHAGKASQAAMGGMRPPGQGAPVEVATAVPVGYYAGGYDAGAEYNSSYNQNAPAVPSYSQDSWLNSPEALAWANTPAVAPVYSGGQSGGMPQYSNVPVYVTNRASASDDPVGSLIDQLTAPAVPTYSRESVPLVGTSDNGGQGTPRSQTGGIVTSGDGSFVRGGDGSVVTWGDYTAPTPAPAGNNPDEADPSDSSGGGGGNSTKIVCTAMNHAYGFGSFRNSIWLTYSAQHMTKAHEAGYHALFLPLVDYGFKRGDGRPNMAVRKALEWIARHRTKDLRAEMRGTKRDITGRALRFVFEPLCYAVGKLKGY